MAISRCPQCEAILTAEETSLPVCPCCAYSLRESPAEGPAPAQPAPVPAVPEGGGGVHPLGWAALGGLLLLLLAGILVASSPTGGSSLPDLARLRQEAEASQAKARAALERLTQAQAETQALADRLAALEKSSAEAGEVLTGLKTELATAREQVAKLQAEKKETLGRLDALQALQKATPAVPPRNPGGEFRVIHIDRPDGEYRQSVMNNGIHVKLVGRVKTLRVEHVEGSMLDASELQTKEVQVSGGINSKSTVKLACTGGSVTIPFIDSRCQVDIHAPDSKVKIGWVNGGAKVQVHAREFTLQSYLDGVETTLTATLSAGGRLEFREIRGRTQLLWKKARETDPDVEVKAGAVRAPAEFRRVMPNQ